MAGPNAIVALVARIDPPADKTGAAELLRHHPDGVSVAFEGEQTTRLFQGHVGAGYLDILEQLRRMRAPAYVEFRPDTREITRLLIPLVSRVAKVDELGDGGVGVELDASHARHFLKRDTLGYDELLATLRRAAEKREPVAVTESDDQAIIDVRPWPQEPAGPANPVKEQRPGLFARLARLIWWPFGLILWPLRWIWWPFRCCGCISTTRAQQLFDLVSAQTCNPLSVPPPCIPFLYPDDGCWARAHEMCRLLINAGASPKKIWIDGNLHTPTRNNPACFVHWYWHVAPTLCVRLSWFHCEDMVIDPSLFTKPVTEAAWKGVQGDASATLTPTAASVYMRPAQTDPGYTDTNVQLNYYRQKLKLRSLQPAGPPPYAFCP